MDLQGRQIRLPEHVDVLIVGAGPAGLLLAAQLSRFRDVTTCVIEQRPGRLEKGHADGLQIRTLEIFKAIGIADKVVSEGYCITEMTFWESGDGPGIQRVSQNDDQDQEVSEMPHLILSQSHVHDHLQARIDRSENPSTVAFGCTFETFQVRDRLNVARISVGDKKHVISAKYLVGCDGAKSATRTAAQIPAEMQSKKKIWGVMDCLAITTFPDIRRKCAIRSADLGSILLIPKPEVEDNAARIYVEMNDSNVTAESIVEMAQKIMHPYALDVVDVVWWSRYGIEQNLCTTFQNSERPTCFLTGDACHTHSPKAGQGMNTSLADAFNLGWKLAAVIRGSCDESILTTYNEERHAVAEELINFDKDLNAVFTSESKTGEQELKDMHHRHGMFMAGLAIEYPQSIITAHDLSNQDLASGYPLGQRFRSYPVLRCSDSNTVELANALPADGRWRLVVLAGSDEPTDKSARTWRLSEWLRTSPQSPINKYTRQGADIDSTIAVLAVYRTSHLSFNIFESPAVLLPRRGHLHGVPDPNQVFTDRLNNAASIYERAGVCPQKGAVVVVRPDQYVAAVMGLDDTAKLAQFFDRFMKKPSQTGEHL